jgi:polysaccharide pyruvyl transferase CsaB
VGHSAGRKALGKDVHHVKKDFRVALCGFYGYGNLGDELLAESLVALLEEEGIRRDRIMILSRTPRETAARLKTGAVDRNRPLAVWKALRNTETFLLGGGGLFQDSTSLRSCVYYWGTVRMAEMAGCIPWAFGQSIGPLARRPSEFLALDALKRCKARFVRDDLSLDWLEQRGLEGHKAPDPVFGLSGFGKASGKGPYLLLNVRPWKDDLPRRTAEAARDLAFRSEEEIIGIALSPEDERCMTDFQEEGIIRFSEIRRIKSAREALEIWPERSTAIGMRLHFCILSVMAGQRCVAVPYDPKVSAFAKEWHLPLWNGYGPLPMPEQDTDLSGKLEKTRHELASAMHAALKTVFSGGSHGA